MFPADFDDAAPTTVDEVLSLVAERGDLRVGALVRSGYRRRHLATADRWG